MWPHTASETLHTPAQTHTHTHSSLYSYSSLACEKMFNTFDCESFLYLRYSMQHNVNLLEECDYKMSN